MDREITNLFLSVSSSCRVFISTKTILKTSNFISCCTSCVVHRYDGGLYMKYQNLVNNDGQVILIAWRKCSACRVCVMNVT